MLVGGGREGKKSLSGSCVKGKLYGEATVSKSKWMDCYAKGEAVRLETAECERNGDGIEARDWLQVIKIVPNLLFEIKPLKDEEKR